MKEKCYEIIDVSQDDYGQLYVILDNGERTNLPIGDINNPFLGEELKKILVGSTFLTWKTGQTTIGNQIKPNRQRKKDLRLSIFIHCKISRVREMGLW